jgi:acetyltransferase-like isoleucine patch superfamily enzyme
MFFKFYQILKRFYPSFLGQLVKLLISNKQLIIGSNFKCSSFPDFNITGNGKVIIGDNVVFKERVELRSHNDAEVRIGNQVKLDREVRLLACNQSLITINEKVRIGIGTVLNGGDSITIGANSLVSGYCYLQTSMHRYEADATLLSQGYDHGKIEIGADNWLGAHVVVFPNVSLGDRCVVGSNAVVTKSFEERNVIGGIPAKNIK